MTRKPEGVPSRREAGLRRLAAGNRDRVETTLRHALVDLHGTVGPMGGSAAVRALVSDVVATFPPDIGAEHVGAAVWRLIEHEVNRMEPPDVRAALTAALHLDPANLEASIDKRLVFARDRGDFGVQPTGRKPGYDALRHWWGEGVRRLGHALDERLDSLRQHPDHWHQYLAGPDETPFRKPFEGAQPVFVELLITTVFMKGRSVRRRITERLVTAQEDNVRCYTAWALPESTDAPKAVPTTALWGCRAEPVSSGPDEPLFTRLWFPTPLRRGQRHFFSSEVFPGNVGPRRAIDVEVDHYGIAPGGRAHDSIPVSGLTIRISFDLNDLPDAVWWYSDVAERDRYVRPSAGDNRWLEMTSLGHVEHTFAQACQPRAHYGLSISWPIP